MSSTSEDRTMTAAAPLEAGGGAASGGPVTVTVNPVDPAVLAAELSDTLTASAGYATGGVVPPPTVEASDEGPLPALSVGIVGYTASRLKAPQGEAGWELWGLNNLHLAPDIDPRKFGAWYDLHDLDTIRGDQPHVDWLTAGADGLPVYVWEPQPEWPTTVRYPVEQVLGSFPRYFTNSVSWMTAHAIVVLSERAAAQGRPLTDCTIGVWGIDMATGGEYCVAPDTLVLTEALTWVPAGDLKPGDRLVGFDEDPVDRNKYRHYRTAEVVSTDRVVLPSVRLTMEDGTKLVSSDQHRWLTHSCNQHQWKTADRLKTAQHREGRPSRIVKLTDVWGPDRSWDAGYLAAAFDGEGHLSMTRRSGSGGAGTSVTLGFAQRDNEMAATVRACLSRLDVTWREHVDRSGCHKFTVTGGRSEIMRLLGTVRPPRLLDKFSADMLGIVHSKANVAVTDSEPVGDRELVALKTTTGTFIAEGFASHNSSQRPSCEFFLGVAMGLGIRVELPDSSDLLKAAVLYGAEKPALLAKLEERKGELAGRMQQLRAEHDQLSASLRGVEANLNAGQGALDQLAYIEQVWFQPDRAANSTHASTTFAKGA